MSVKVEWDNVTRTVLRWDLAGDWNWDEVWITKALALTMLKPVDHRVHFMVTFACESSFRLPEATLEHLRKLTLNELPGEGLIVFVGTSLTSRSITGLLTHFFPDASHRVVFTDTADKARLLLSGAGQSLAYEDRSAYGQQPA
jgi:hypothetical protein